MLSQTLVSYSYICAYVPYCSSSEKLIYNSLYLVETSYIRIFFLFVFCILCSYVFKQRKYYPSLKFTFKKSCYEKLNMFRCHKKILICFSNKKVNKLNILKNNVFPLIIFNIIISLIYTTKINLNSS